MKINNKFLTCLFAILLIFVSLEAILLINYKSRLTIYKDYSDYIFLELNNRELKDEIIKYTAIAEKKLGNKTFIVTVFCTNLNDSVSRYVIHRYMDPFMWGGYPFHFICKVNGRDVLFSMTAANNTYCYPVVPFFRMKKKGYYYFMKRYFPKKYDEYTKRRKMVEVTDDSGPCYLTFYKDKLVGKYISPFGGLYNQKVYYKIGNTLFYE